MILLLLACAESPCPTWYSDLDGDGYGVGDGVDSCEVLAGRSRWAGDCDDTEAEVHPGAIDLPGDGIDQNCNRVPECRYPIPTDYPSSVDCTQGQTYKIGADLDYWPGDCICEVDGDLSLRADQIPLLGPVRVTGHLRIGTHTDWDDATDGAWDGVGMSHLQEVDGDVWVNTGQNASLRLEKVGGALNVKVAPTKTFSLPDLRTLGTLMLDTPRLSLPALELVGTLQASDGLYDLPQLLEVRTLLIQDATLNVPALAQLNRLELDAPGRTQRLSRLTAVHQVLVENGTLELPRLKTLKDLQVFGGAVVASAVEGIDTLRVDGDLSAHALERVDELSFSSELSLPNLRELRALYGTGELDAPQLYKVKEVELDGGRILHELQSVTQAVVNNGDPRMTQLRTRGLNSLIVESGTGVVEGPEYLRTLEPQSGSGLVLLRTLAVGEIQTGGWIDAPDLLEAESIQLWGSGSYFPALRSVSRLNVSDCEAFPALRRAPDELRASCPFDLRGMASFPARVTLSGSGPFLVPDPFPSSLWMDHGFPALDLQRVDGALLLAGSASENMSVREVGGNLQLALSGTTLGLLSELESVEKDLRHCAPDVPIDTLLAWFDSVDVGGSVINTCE